MADTVLFHGPLTEQYRPHSWADVVGQDKIVQRVQALAKRGLAGRAYWISGQSGTGKTTIARLIAADVADELLIREVDAAGLTVTARCAQCGEYLERTPSGYLACPRGHGKLLTEPPAAQPATEADAEDDDESIPAWSWPQQARRIAKRHAARDNWHGCRWHCRCGACSRARLDGFIPRERVER